MRQEELIAFIIEQGSVTSGEVAERFNVPVTFAHQVLRRLKDRGILGRSGGPYPYTFHLTSEAGELLQDLRESHGSRAWVFLLGLGIGLVLGFASRGGNKDDESEKDAD